MMRPNFVLAGGYWLNLDHLVAVEELGPGRPGARALMSTGVSYELDAAAAAVLRQRLRDSTCCGPKLGGGRSITPDPELVG